MQKNNFPPKKRELSKFLAEELLFDYITSHLDAERELAVKNAIQKDSELKEEEDAMRRALVYLEDLSKTTVSEPLIERVTKDPSWFLVLKSSLHWSEWPEPVKWFAEALVVSAVVAVVAVLIPWNNLNWFESNKGEVPLVKEKKVTVFTPIEPQDTEEQGTKLQEPKPESEERVEDTASVEEVDEDFSEEADKQQINVEVKKPESQVFSKVEDSKPAVQKTKKKKKGNAFVYRSFMEIENTSEKAPLITAIIQKYGGEKAGQVILGWEKPNGNYFHFKLPEKNYEQAMQEIKAFGKISSSKTEHRRVMPEGVVRVILWVKEKKLKK